MTKTTPRLLTGLAVALVATVGLTGAAGADPAPDITPSITFHDAAGTVTAYVPPQCPANAAVPCTWRLYENEPLLTPPVFVTDRIGPGGTTLTDPYPEGFCGTIQADVLYKVPDTGSGPWQYVVGVRHFDSDGCGTTTTTTTVPSTTTTTTEPSTTTTTTTEPSTTTTTLPVVPPPSTLPPPGGPTAPPVVVPVTPASAAPVLAYTGVNYWVLAALGIGLAATGLVMMLARRKRMAL